MMKIYFGTA